MWTMEQHIKELRAMREVCRTEGITDKSLAEHFDCTPQSIFDILQGTTKEGELRANVYRLLTTRELLDPFLDPKAAPQIEQAPLPKKVRGVPKLTVEFDPAALKRAWEDTGETQGAVAKKIGVSLSTLSQTLAGCLNSGPAVAKVCEYLLHPDHRAAYVPHQQRQQHPRKAKESKPSSPSEAALPAPAISKPSLPQVIVLPTPKISGEVSEEALWAQAAALEELAEAVKDLAVLRQAEKRWTTAMAIARSVGLQIGQTGRDSLAA